MTRSTWVEEARRVPLRDLCASLGLAMREGRRASLVCPSCRATRRGGSDRRLPATVNGSGRWTCWACGAWGDSIDLVSYALTGDRYRGQAEVRSWPGWGSIAPSAAPLPEAEPPRYLPESELIKSRAAAHPCTTDPPVRAWVEERLGPDPSVRVLGLVRALRGGDRPWMRLRQGRDRPSWYNLGLRALFPTWDALGQHRGWRARKIRTTSGPKAVGPTGYSSEGLVLANGHAVRMLRRAARPDLVIVTEGEPAYLAWAAAHPRAAVIGIGSGWWTPQHADAVPDGARVVLATDHDPAGERYAAQVARTLNDRCTLSRWRP